MTKDDLKPLPPGTEGTCDAVYLDPEAVFRAALPTDPGVRFAGFCSTQGPMRCNSPEIVAGYEFICDCGKCHDIYKICGACRERM